MPRLVRLYLRSILAGFVLAVLFTALLIGLDVGHLRHLVMHVSAGWLAVVMLVVFHTILFSGVQFAVVVMGMAESSAPTGGARQRRRPCAPMKVALTPVVAAGR